SGRVVCGMGQEPMPWRTGSTLTETSGGEDREQDGCQHLRFRLAAGAGGWPVPDGAAGGLARSEPVAAAAAGCRGAPAGRARLGRRADSGDGGGTLGRRAPRAPGDGARQPSPGRARGPLRRGVRPLPAFPAGVKFFVACARGLEYLLADELAALGASRATAAIAGVNVEDD